MRYRALSVVILLLLSGCEMATFKSKFDYSQKSWSVPTMARLKSDLKGNIDSSLLGDYLAVRIAEDERHLVISLPAPNLFQNWEREIPELPGAKIKAIIKQDEKSFLELYYPLYLLITDFSKWKSSKLPSGHPIPGISNGQAPSVSFDIDKEHKATIFFNKGVVGVLLNVPYDPLLAMTIPIKNKLGNIYTIPKEGSELGAILLVLNLPQNIMKALEGE
ncbi:MAG: hypothetical protein A4S09_16900 [Proteobacteria bacterium SG_bin7]|nr:MAG: hypothetical protein A4S09_16900 [Proteobacteria bacterium SG_bin7]